LLATACAVRINEFVTEDPKPEEAANAKDAAPKEEGKADGNGTKAGEEKKDEGERPEEALEDLKSRANDLILGKSARPSNEVGKHFEREHAYWYWRDLKDWKEEQERQRLIDAGIILPDIPDHKEDESRKFVKPQMSDDERLALEMQAKMSKLNAQ
jgi:hypothetical protein